MLSEYEALTVGEHADLHADRNVGELATWEAEPAPATDDTTWADLVEDLTNEDTEESHK